MANAKNPERPGPIEYPDAFAQNARKMLKHFVKLVGSQNEAAHLLGVSQPRISLVMSGAEQPKLSLLIELRKHLQMPLDLILGLPLLIAEEEMGKKASRIHSVADSNSPTHQVGRSPRR